jgi:alpha-L-arabinofuranosidase
MDFLLPAHDLVIETKVVRDRTHAKRIGDELIVDIEHNRRHPKCHALWCVIYDPDHLITNAEGLRTDLQGARSASDGKVEVKVLVLQGS